MVLYPSLVAVFHLCAELFSVVKCSYQILEHHNLGASNHVIQYISFSSLHSELFASDYQLLLDNCEYCWHRQLSTMVTEKYVNVSTYQNVQSYSNPCYLVSNPVTLCTHLFLLNCMAKPIMGCMALLVKVSSMKICLFLRAKVPVTSKPFPLLAANHT